MGKVLQIVCMVTILVTITVNMTNAQAGTLGFYLDGTPYPSGSTVLRTDIGEGADALQCTTDSTTCCTNTGNEIRAGNFYMPNGGIIVLNGTTMNGYYRTRGSQHIRLNRRSPGTITGQFQCTIPQANGAPADLFINIVDILITITPSGGNTAGDGYSLMCSLTVTGSADQPTISWLSPTNMVVGNVNTLIFNPLTASDAGKYTCRAILGSAEQTEDVNIIVMNPSITVSVSGDVAPMAGMMLTLTCNVDGEEMINDRTTGYRWSRNAMVVSEQTQPTWSFSPFAFSDAGQYSCAVDISSTILPSSPISAVSDPFNITLSLPDPSMVTITSSFDNLITFGVNVTLTCTVELSTNLASVSSVGVAITWTGPTGMLSSSSMPMMSGTSPPTYTGTLMLSAVMSDGTYTCQAMTVSSSPYLLPSGSMNDDITITVAPTITVYVTSSVATPMVGSMYSLTCTVTGAERLTDTGAMVTYQWLKNDDILSNEAMATLSFQILTISAAGRYICQATVTSSLLSDPIATNSTNNIDVTLTLPNPAVMIESTPVSPIPPVGLTVTLTCTVDLSQLVDVPVNVTAQISAPLNVAITPVTNSMMENATRYTSTATVSLFGREQSGEYSCTANIELLISNSFITGIIGLDKITIGTGVYLSLRGVVYANNGAIQITEIGETNSISNTGLQCITDRMPCCLTEPNRAGEWYFHDGVTTVPNQGGATSFYRSRGDDGTVNLNRLNTNVMMPIGLFCCEVPDAAGDTQPLCANIVSIGVMITLTGIPTAGQNYSLDCSVTGTTDPATYQWFNSNGTQLTSTSQLQFSPLLTSHAGTYTCRAIVGSVVMENNNMVEVDFPAPTAVTVTAPLGVIAGASVNLTCAVELSPAVDVPVTVNTQWTGPADVILMPANPVPALIVNTTTYVSTVSVSAARTGSYTCQATITSGGITSGSTDITIAPLPPPTNLRAVTTTPTSITLTWEQPEGADAVDRYEINYRYVIEECDLEGGRASPPVTVSVNDGTLKRYTLNNSAWTPVEEDSLFRITLTAVNSVTISVPSQPAVTTTPEAVSGLVQSLTASSVSVTNITIRWDRVDCQERNGRTDGYRIIYYPTLTPNDHIARTLVGIEENDRMLSITGLPPQTNYTFEVQASNPNIDVRGPPAFYTASTTAPQGVGFLLDSQLYGNNSIVTVTAIGSSIFISALFCLTPSLECCNDRETPNAASVTREWYLPDGRPVASDNSPFIKNRVSSAVSLHRDQFVDINTAPAGVYRCEIPDASGTSQNIYVGIYPQGDGSPSITSLVFDTNSTTLTCTSTGGPPTTVTWRKNGVTVDLSLYEQSQRLVDAVEATYQSVLFNENVTKFVGTFTCEVSNARVTVPVQETVELNGVFIVRDQFSVGESATASCKSEAPALMIEWLRDGMVVESAAFTGIQELDLVFSPVSDSIHTQVYVCRVTRDGGNRMTVTAVQNFTVNVDVPPNTITATVSSSGTATAGMVYNLTCNVSKTVGGLTDSPTATWTTGGVAITNGNGITVSGTTGDMTITSTLTFDPLRTSHEGSFVCRGALTSPALDTALMPSATENLEIHISTPDMVITVPSGPLFAGHMAPLTLTCTISINSATDTDIEISDMDITWLRGSTRLSNDDARVTISSVTGSRPPFTSTLTLDPLSTADNTTFTCRARARTPTGVASLVTTSEMGEGTVSVIINPPSPPTVSIDPFNRLETAGQPLILNCSASIQEGIRGTPVLTWTREDASLSSDVTSAPPLLSFPSLRTSHAGRYTCSARLNIPEAGVDILGIRTTNVSIQFMPTPPIISGSPRNTSFFQGLDLIFTCSITLGDVVDTPVTVRGIWNRDGTELMDGDENGRIIIVNHPMSSPPYDITLRFNPLHVIDAGTYECDVTVTPQDTTFISAVTTSDSQAISVSAFPTQFVDVTAEGISAAGYSGYTLICNTSREPDLPPTSTLAVEWLDPRGNIISSGENFTISGVGPTTDVGLISRLVFNNSLYTSQAGDYTCRTLQTIPGTVMNHPELLIFSVRVKLSAPISPLTYRRSRNTALNAGTSFSLTCIITPNTTGVDTDIIVESSIMGNGVSDTGRVSVSSQPVSVGENTFETTVTFSHLLEADAGVYNCSAYITSPPSLPNMITSDFTSGLESISIGPLQAPTISVSPIQGVSLEAGGQDTITCAALFDEYLVERPTLVWEFPQGSDTADTTMGDQSGVRGTTNRTLTFICIRTSQAGVYTCRATIDIQGIDSLCWITSQTVRVQIPRPVFSVLPHPTAYNGTNLTIFGRIQQDSNVDTDVTISGIIWSGGTSSIVTTAQIMLSLLPVATDSSGEYTVTYTIRSSDNSPHIIEYNGTDSYNLEVAPLPSRSPTISIVSRHQLDGCGEVMTLNCTATQVENLFSPPTIMWIAPGGSEVPAEESSNPRMNPQTRELIFDDITSNNRGQYTCRSVVSIPQAQIDDYSFGTDTVQVNTDLPGEIRNLVCAMSSSASELSFSWDLPTLLGSEVVSYQVIVNRLEHRPGTREVIQSAMDEQFVGIREASVVGLAAEVPYSVTVKAINLAGCGEENQTYCFTQEGEPPPPENVVFVRFNPTSIGVSWNKFTLVELKGLANYIVTYTIIIDSRKRQSEVGGTVIVPWTQNQAVISGLQSGAEYDVTVRTSTAAGMSAPVRPGNRMSIATPSSSDNTVAVIGGVVAVVLIIAATTAIIIITVALVLRNRKAQFSPNQKPLPYEVPGSVMLSDLSPNTNKERVVYETIEITDHEYEILDKYNQATATYEDVKIPPLAKPQPTEVEAVQLQPMASTGDYEFTQCPAYAPVTTTSIHSNTNKPAETPFTQPTAAQDDQ